MSRAPVKTNAARIFDALGIHYELREYEVDEEDLSAESVARKVGLPPEQVFKTLVCRGDRSGVLFAVVPAGSELDFKAAARLSSDRSMEMVALREDRSEEHTSELQSRPHLVCRLLLEKKSPETT